MNRSEYLEEFKKLIMKACEELSKKDIDILVHSIYSESAYYIARKLKEQDEK